MVGISFTELFDMELWQFLCYIEGYNKRAIQTEISNVLLAVRTGQYAGQYFTGKRAPDANKVIDKLQKCYDGEIEANEESDEVAEDKINKLKENLKLFD